MSISLCSACLELAKGNLQCCETPDSATTHFPQFHIFLLPHYIAIIVVQYNFSHLQHYEGVIPTSDINLIFYLTLGTEEKIGRH